MPDNNERNYYSGQQHHQDSYEQLYRNSPPPPSPPPPSPPPQSNYGFAYTPRGVTRGPSRARGRGRGVAGSQRGEHTSSRGHRGHYSNAPSSSRGRGTEGMPRGERSPSRGHRGHYPHAPSTSRGSRGRGHSPQQHPSNRKQSALERLGPKVTTWDQTEKRPYPKPERGERHSFRGRGGRGSSSKSSERTPEPSTSHEVNYSHSGRYCLHISEEIDAEIHCLPKFNS